MADEQASVSTVPPSVEAFARQLVIASKVVALYPSASSMPLQSAEQAENALSLAIEECSQVTFDIAKQGLYFEGAPLLHHNLAAQQLCKDFYQRRLASICFHAGASAKDIVALLAVLKLTPEELVALGGYEVRLADSGVGAITAIETQVTLVDERLPEGSDGEGGSPDHERSTAVGVRPKSPRSRERVELARVSGDAQALSRYLAGEEVTLGASPDLKEIAKRFTELAQMMAEQSDAGADSLAVAFGKALWALGGDTRTSLLEQELLPSACKLESLAKAVRRVGLEDILRMLAEKGIGEEDSQTRTGFERAVRNLVQINQYDRGQVADAVTSVLLSAGASEQQIGRVLEHGVPGRLTMLRAQPAAMKDPAAATALRLVDNAPISNVLDAMNDPEVAALQEESAHGVTDAEVIAALVTLVGLDSRETPFATTMSALEDTLDTLVARGQITTAADAAQALMSAAKNPGLSPQQVHRLEESVSRFAKSDDIRAITRTLRGHQPGDPEYEAATELLDTLGVFAIRPLLEQLAAEEDWAERKVLVELLSRSADKYIKQLGSHMTDSRWYFVRNVVAILGTTRSQDALGPLERALRYPESRVRREAIRSISVIRHPRATTLLAVALDDADAQNVQLAARYLGVLGTSESVQPLEVVARGEGVGNRENGPRIEAMEALARLGARDAVPSLEAIARRRSIIGAARTRELRVAAQSALASIKARGGA